MARESLLVMLALVSSKAMLLLDAALGPVGHAGALEIRLEVPGDALRHSLSLSANVIRP